MPKNWKTYKLGDLIEVKHGFAFKGEFFSDEPTSDILLTPGNFKIGGGFKADKFKYYNGEYPTEYILREGDIIITMTDLSKAGDTLGYSAKIPKHDGIRFLHNQRLGLVILKSKDVDADFLYWLLRTQPYQYFIIGSATGSTVKHTSPTRICNYKFEAPSDQKKQTQIASILSCLDNKIELNLQMNLTLEAMAQAIFKEWFVDFKFPGSSKKLVNGLPKGWSKELFKNQFDAERGLSYKGSGLSENGEGVPMHNLNSVYEGGGYKYEGIKYYSGEYKERHIVGPREIIVANTEQGHKHLLIGFPAVTPYYFGEEAIFSHHIYRIRPKPTSYLTPQFIYYLLLQQDVREQVIGCANGTTVNMLKVDGLQVPQFNMPAEDIVVKFSELVETIWQRKETNYLENQSLIKIRDSLLPKLMTGTIQVKA